MAVEAVRIDERRSGPSFRTLSLPEARALLLYGIERRRPVQLVVGRAGTGKSRLLGALSRAAVPDADLLLLRELPDTLEATTALLARRFGVEDVAGESPLERLARLADVLAERRRRGRLVALLLDDAHLLSPGALLDVRLLAGTDAAGGALLPIVMAGRPELATTVETAVLEPLRLALSTRIELCRPLAAMDRDDSEASSDPDDGTPPPRRWPLAGASALVAAAALAVVMHGLDVPRSAPIGRPPMARPAAPVTPAPVTPAHVEPPPPAASPEPPPPVVAEGPPALRSGTVTPDAARALVAEFATALASRDLRRLSHLLARDARQNGIRGRGAILDTYAYRFARLDVPIAVGAPSRITLRNDTAMVEVPFGTEYRDAAGNVGRLDGMLLLRVVRHRGRPVVDSIDWAFAGEPGGTPPAPPDAGSVAPAA